MAAFASGGRRRSEIASLRLEQLRDEPALLSDPADPASMPLPCLSIRLGPTKTTEADDDAKALMIGPPVVALKAWIARAKIARGPVFRAIDRWGTLEERAMSPQSVNLIVKRRCAAPGLDPREFSAHGLRAGYLTEASRQGVSLPEAIQQSQHRSVQQGASYHNDADRTKGKATRLAI
jgi:integrase